MKVLTTVFAIVLALAGLAGAQPIAQSVNVHFDHAVMVGRAEMPAGNYTIQAMRLNSNVLLIVRSELGHQATVLANSVDTGESVESGAVNVVLRRVGNTYSLSRVVVAPGVAYQVLE